MMWAYLTCLSVTNCVYIIGDSVIFMNIIEFTIVVFELIIYDDINDIYEL